MKVSRKLIGGSIVLAAITLLAAPASASLPRCFEICTCSTSCDQGCFSIKTTTCGIFELCEAYCPSNIQESPDLGLNLSEGGALTEAAVNDDALEPSTGPTDPNRDVVQPEVP